MRRCVELSHRDALDIVEAIHDEVERRGKAATIAVCDRHGELHAYLRMDGARMSVGPIAMNKAFTAAREEVESESVGEAAREYGFPITNFGDLRFLGWPGGIPIRVDGVVIGAVGVSGLPDEEDIEMARLGVAVVEGRTP
jgi:glc operon protein GlcG